MRTVTNAHWLESRVIALSDPDRRSTDGHNHVIPLRPMGRKARALKRYVICPARTAYQFGEASMLVRQMYAWRGYATGKEAFSPDDPYRLTLNAWQNDDLLATLTIGCDSPTGLLADTLYANELASLRGPNRVVCEVSRLAANPKFNSGDVLSALFRAALQYGKELFAASDAVIEVNPRHAGYYQRRYGFMQIGNQRQCPRVDAPAVLLHQVLDEIQISDGELAWG